MQLENVIDPAYLGIQNDYPMGKYKLPFKKKRAGGPELSRKEKS